jgi:hypothetical protein
LCTLPRAGSSITFAASISHDTTILTRDRDSKAEFPHLAGRPLQLSKPAEATFVYASNLPACIITKCYRELAAISGEDGDRSTDVAQVRTLRSLVPAS